MSDLPIPNVPEDITPQWLSAVLDACVSSVELSPIAGGNSSTTLRAAVRIESRADLPLSLIIKLPHTNPAIRSRVERDGYYAREVGFYRELAAKMGDNVSRCFYAAHDPTSGRSAIVIEDRAGPGVAVGDSVKGCLFEQAAEAMRTIAQMHAGFWKSPGLERLTWLPAHSDLYQNLIQAMTDAWNRYPAHLLSQMSPALIETIELFCPRADQVVARTSGDPWTLTHGDYRLDNLLFGAQGKVIAFDWQICARAQGARDAAYFARELVDGHPIAETWQPLLDLYFTTLTESGVEYTERAFAQDVRVNTLQNMRGMVTLFVDRDFTIPRMRAASAATIERANWMAEHLDLPGLLRDEFPS